MGNQKSYSDKSPPATQLNTNSWRTSNEQEKKPATIKGDFSVKYPFQWDERFFSDIKFDDREIPYATRPGLKKPCYDPTLIAAYGLYNHNQFLIDGEIMRRYTALRMADWLQGNIQEWQGLFFAWPIEYDEPFYQISEPWISCQTQGLAISLLLRVAFLNNDARYEETVQKAAKLFFVSQEAGGFVSRFEDGGLAFETFTGKNQTLPLIGNLFAIIGVYELAHYFQDRNQETVFNSAITGIQNNLDRYQNNNWIFKDLHPSRRVATREEVAVMAELLNLVSKLCDDETLALRGKSWLENYETAINGFHYFIKMQWDKFRFRNVYASK
ncbi:MAG: hypothetical protein DWQ05_18210 [Calditrichaeota bacterium]|nr:MAG: hypothetical protein DWQ05_18210 [Calditrichota bacterium]